MKQSFEKFLHRLMGLWGPNLGKNQARTWAVEHSIYKIQLHKKMKKINVCDCQKCGPVNDNFIEEVDLYHTYDSFINHNLAIRGIFCDYYPQPIDSINKSIRVSV